MNAELAKRGFFQFAIGGVIFDVLGIAAELVALMQHRRVAVSEPRTFVEIAAGQFAQAIEMRLDMAEQRVGEMQSQQIGQRRIGPVEIHARRIGREQSRLIGRACRAIMHAWLHI